MSLLLFSLCYHSCQNLQDGASPNHRSVISYTDYNCRLISKGRIEQAAKSLRVLRGKKISEEQIEWEITALANYSGNEDKGTWKEVFNIDNRVGNSPSPIPLKHCYLTIGRNAPVLQYWLCSSSRLQAKFLLASTVLYSINYKALTIPFF